MVQLTQPVLIQSFQDKFGTKDDQDWETPTLTEQILIKGEEHELLSLDGHKKYKEGVRKLIYLLCWNRLDIFKCSARIGKACISTDHDTLQGNDQVHGILSDNQVQQARIEAQDRIE